MGLWDMSDPDYVKINEIFKLGNSGIVSADKTESSLRLSSDTENTYLRSTTGF